ncbi:MAG: hypothetical protein ACR2PL_03165, partial [Dehalococcoidia bacterium]
GTANAIRPRAATRLTMSPEMQEAARRSTAAGVQRDAEGAMAQMNALQPEYIAPLVIYLATDEASYINGRNFLVGGPQISLMREPTEERTIFNPRGYWTLDELTQVMKRSIGQGMRNQWPMQERQQAPK